MNAPAQPPDARRDLFGTLEKLTGALAGVAALIYLTGGLALQLRLGVVRLPSSAAVPQLPREFLISQGLLIVAPAIAVAALAHWAATKSERSRVASGIIAVVVGIVCYAAIGLLVVTKDPFPAKICLSTGGEVAGVFIGETSERTYLGDLASAHPRRVLSIPQSQVARVVVGGRAQQLREVRCDADQG